MKRRSGSMLLNLLIAIAIIAVILTAVTPFIKKMFFTSKVAETETEIQFYQVRGKGSLKKDILYAGLGLPCRKGNCPALSFSWDSSNITFRYEKDPDDKPYYGVLNCMYGSCTVIKTNYPKSLDTTVVNEDRSQCNYLGSYFLKEGSSISTSLSDGVYVAFGVDVKYNGCSYEGLPVSFPCVKVTYKLKADPECPAGTQDLVRETPTGEEVVYPCVSDMKLYFDYDSNGDGKISATEMWQERNITTVGDLEKLYGIKVLILYTTGTRTGEKVSPTIVNGIPYFKVKIEDKEFLLKLPANYQGYNWEIAIISNKPENLIKRD